MPDIVLSILIPSTFDREKQFNGLLSILQYQAKTGGYVDKIEILSEIDNKEIPTGTKRNLLYARAKGRLSVSIDSDDKIEPSYLESIMTAAEQDIDAIGICGWMTTNSMNRVDWFISKDNDYCASRDENGKEIYIRWNNHISPIRTSIAQQFKFPDVYQGEDYIWSKQIHESGLIKTEIKINIPIYHYDYWQHKG